MSAFQGSNTTLPTGNVVEGLPSYTWLWAASITFLIGTTSLMINLRPKSKLPLVNPPGRFQLQLFKQLEFMKNGLQILSQAKTLYPGKAFRMITEFGETVVLPAEFAQIIRNDEGLSFRKAVERDFNANLAGFEPFSLIGHDRQIAQGLIRKQLTQSLNAVESIYGNLSDWQEVTLRPTVLDLISRLSSRVFLGEELCRNEAWLEITKAYTIDAFKSAMTTFFVPPIFKPILSWFSPDYKRVRHFSAKAFEVITPVIEKRRSDKAKAKLEGKDIPKFNDALEWLDEEEEANGQSFNPAVFQLLLSFAAIHTTTDLLCQTLLCLANEPELIAPIREEIVQVLGTEGLKKSALYNLKLMDSAIKEAQRMKPNFFLGMNRLVLKDIDFPDAGFTVYKGERVMVDATNMMNPEIHTDPTKFDIYRFLRMREQPVLANKAQSVTTSPDHLAFGHGKNACPGRFFAVNEVKVALCHLLLKYDWKLAEDTRVEPVAIGVSLSMDPETRIMFRRRGEELKLEKLSFD